MNRILFSNNGTLHDWTKELNDYKSGSRVFDFTSGQDALYIGSRLPFNHLYFKLKENNLVSAAMTVEYWSTTWQPVVELRDETNGFTQSGFITFTPDKDEFWEIEDTDEGVSGLTSKVIYDHYWLKITFNNTLTASTEISWVGQVFSDDYDLASEYPELCRPQTFMAFENGKISWEEQHVKAAEILAQDLIHKGVIYDKAQILNRDDYKNASVQKVAELIFNAFGDDYVDQRQRAREEYFLRLDKRVHKIDTNRDAVENISERKNTTGWLKR